MALRPLRLAGQLFGGSLLGKLLGFAREIEMARALGAGNIADSFRGAVTAVLLPVAPLQGDLLAAVLIPACRKWRAQGRGAEFSTAVSLVLGTISLLLAVVTYLLAAQWVGLLLGGFGPDALALATRFVQIMVLAIPPSVLSACLGAMEIAAGMSRIASLRAASLNLGVLTGIIVAAATGSPIAIAWGFALAWILVMVYAVMRMIRLGEISARALGLKSVWEANRVLLMGVRPLLVLPVAEQASFLVERVLGSRSVTGTLASLDYARTLTETILILISQPIGFAMLAQSADTRELVEQRVRSVTGPVLALAIPASVFALIFADDLVRLAFQRGAFGAEAVVLTAAALRGIAAGLWAATLGWVLLRIVNAAGRNGTAAIILAAAFTANVLANLAAAPLLGSMGLGLGEAARGSVMLAGSAIALGCWKLVLSRVAALLPGAAVLALLGLTICSTVDSSLARILIGATVFGLCVLLWFMIFLPQRVRQVFGVIGLSGRLGRDPAL